MHISKTYPRTIFPSKTIAEAINLVNEWDVDNLRQRQEADASLNYISASDVNWELSISREDQGEEWRLDSVDEWYGAYDRGASSSYLYYSAPYSPYSLSVRTYETPDSTSVSVEAPTQSQVERVLRIFTKVASDYQTPMPSPEPLPDPPVVVFLGHGRSSDWREIKDHLQDSHHYKVEAYEVGARAGHTIRDVLTSMLTRSSFALLVMTGEDDSAEGGVRARQNVVHEAGLFQGHLGFERAIAVVENGVEVFSNLDGVQQIRYDKGNVRSTFGEILATLRREFGDRR